MKYTLSVLVENHPGVLSKVSGLFSRRGFNIDSLAVGITEDPAISRMTIVVDGDEHVVEQVEKQLNKVIPVIKVKTLVPADTISRTLSLIKVSVSSNHKGGPTDPGQEIMRIAELMQARIVDATRTTMTIEFSDTMERTETLEALLRPYGIKEIVRTGVTRPLKRGRTPPVPAKIMIPLLRRGFLSHNFAVPYGAGGNYHGKNLLSERLQPQHPEG